MQSNLFEQPHRFETHDQLIEAMYALKDGDPVGGDW